MPVQRTTSKILSTSKIYKRAVKHAIKHTVKHLAEQPHAIDLKTRLNAIMHKRGLSKILNKLFPQN